MKHVIAAMTVLATVVCVAGWLATPGESPLAVAVMGADTANENARAASSSGESSYGLSKRIPWTTSHITGSPDLPPPYETERVFRKLEFVQPVCLTFMPGTDRLVVAELEGRIRSFHNDPECARTDMLFDMLENIEGLTQVYDIAFHPDFQKNRYCYIAYTLALQDPKGERISRFTVRDTDPPVCDPKSEVILFEMLSGGHNGGCMKFGPKDGYFYVSTGDSSGPNPPDINDTGQDVSDFLASILRVDVDHPSPEGLPYSIPADNPFVGQPGVRPEIWAYGLRNPWKMSFNQKTGELWVGDVGWELWELVFRIQRGGNYGWSIVEGRQPVHPENRRGPTPILPPIVDHPHSESRSVTGGYVYEGTRLKDLVGAYIYGDYVTGKIWALRNDGDRVTWHEEIAQSRLQIITFGEDANRNLYVVDFGGTIHQLVPNKSVQHNANFPKKLSETGLFSSVADHVPAPGVLPFSINAEQWADFTTAERLLALPDESRVQPFRTGWVFPNDAVLAKTISLDMNSGDPASRRRLETQVLHFDGYVWNGYTYVWNEDQTDAILADADGTQQTFFINDADAPAGTRQIDWRVYSRAECLACHNPRMGTLLGFSLAQLNKDHDYDGTESQQVKTLEHIGIFSKRLTSNAPHLTDPHDQSADIDARARSYLHANCAHCHIRGGGGTAPFELLYSLPLNNGYLPLEDMFIVGERPTQGTYGISRARVVAPGDPYGSLLWYRMAKLGSGHMPHMGGTVVDEQGMALIHDWIKQLDPHSEKAPDSEPVGNVSDAIVQLSEWNGENGSALESTIESVLSSTRGGLELLHAVDAGILPDHVRQKVLAIATAHSQPEIRDIYERFVPDAERTKRLGTSIKPDELLALPGDSKRGEQVFFSSTAAQCKNCHRIKDAGGQVGPSLDQIGKKYNRNQLLETILEPSKTIDREWVAYTLETTSGLVHSGLLVEKTDDAVVLKDSQAKLIRVPADEVELLVPQPKSLMPELLLRDMTAQQVADLLAYLNTLK